MAWIVSEVLTVSWPMYEELLGSACSLVGGCACSVNASIQWAPGDFPLPFLHIPPPQTPLFAKHQGMHGVAEGWRQGVVCLPCASRGRDHPASLIPQHIPLRAVERSCPTANLSHLPCDKPPAAFWLPSQLCTFSSSWWSSLMPSCIVPLFFCLFGPKLERQSCPARLP